jgi:tetratricopeptide (TPR) repeat protein
MSSVKKIVAVSVVCVLWPCTGLWAQTGSQPAWESSFEQGQQAIQAGRYQEAEQIFVKLQKSVPDVPEISANLGLIYFEEKNFALAIPALERALKLNPKLSRSATILAWSRVEVGLYDKALPELQSAYRQAKDPETKRLCGLYLERTYTGLGRDADAVAVALDLNRLFPDDPEVLYQGERLFGNFAFLSIQHLNKVAPDSLWKHLATAEAYESAGSNEFAIREYRAALALAPNRAGLHYRLGRTLLAQSRQSGSADSTAEAAKEFQRELDVDPGNANAAYELAELHRQAGEFDDARRFFEEALGRHPDFEEAQVGLASVLVTQQKPELALAHLQSAIKLNPDDDVAWYRLSQVERSLGNSEEQQKAFARFQLLRNQQKQSHGDVASPSSDVTPQTLDSNADK